MAVKSKGKKAGGYLVKVKNNPKYCGIGAGGVQFANGKAIVQSERMAQWFREHDGYEVTAAAADEQERSEDIEETAGSPSDTEK